MDADPQVLATLQDVRRLLQILVWLAVVIAIGVTVRTTIYAYVTGRQIKNEGFEALASPLYRDRDFDRLIKLCEEEIAARPENPYAHWYLGLAHFDRGSREPARTHFGRAVSLAPSWRTTVEPYLEKLNGPHERGSSTHSS